MALDDREQPLTDGFGTIAVTLELAPGYELLRPWPDEMRIVAEEAMEDAGYDAGEEGYDEVEKDENESDGVSEASDEENAAWREKCRFESEVVPYVSGRGRYVAQIRVKRCAVLIDVDYADPERRLGGRETFGTTRRSAHVISAPSAVKSRDGHGGRG